MILIERTPGWLSIVVAAVSAQCGCQSASIRMERHTSGAADRDFDFHPTVGPDGHYITFPAHPFVNCFDVIQADAGHDDDLQPIACDASARFQGWLGYRVPQAGTSADHERCVAGPDERGSPAATLDGSARRAYARAISRSENA